MVWNTQGETGYAFYKKHRNSYETKNKYVAIS